MKNKLFIDIEKSSLAGRGLGILLLVAFIAIPVLLVTWLNTGSVNQITTPVVAYLDLFHLIWNDNPLGAIQFIANKSLFSLAHHDARSGLNLWSMEYDAITFIVYLISAWLAASVFKRSRQTSTLALGLLGAVCLASAATYMTSIAHCAGPTWVGFVIYYGLGYENFEHYPYWQIGLAVIGSWLLLNARLRKAG